LVLTSNAVYGFETFTPENHFSIPENSGIVSFANSGSYESVDFENNSWTFVGLIFDNFVLNLTTLGVDVRIGRDVLSYSANGGKYSIGAKNCNISITSLPVFTWYTKAGWLNYTVSGNGDQIFNIYYMKYDRNWTVYIDGEPRPQKDGWDLQQTSTDELIMITNATNDVSIYYRYEPPPKNGPIDDDSALFSVIIGFFTSTSGIVLLVFTLLFVGVITLLVIIAKRKRKSAEVAK
jgi:hypothetical protein